MSLTRQGLRDTLAVEPGEPDDDEAALTCLFGRPWPVVIVIEPRTYTLYRQSSIFALNGGEAFDPQNPFDGEDVLGALCKENKVDDRIDFKDETFEIIVIVLFAFGIVMGRALIEVIFNHRIEAEDQFGIESAVFSRKDLDTSTGFGA